MAGPVQGHGHAGRPDVENAPMCPPLPGPDGLTNPLPAGPVDDWWLADSELLGLVPTAQGCELRVAAAAVQRQAPGAPPVRLSGHLSRLVLTLTGVVPGPWPVVTPGRLRAGSQLQVDGQRLAPLRLPFQADGECVLTLCLGDGSEWTLQARKVAAAAAPGARFHESLAC